MTVDPVVLEFNNRLVEHLAADRLYYRSTFWWKADKVVAVLLLVFGIFVVSVVGVRWWAVVWFPLAIVEWFNLLSVRPLQIRFFFNRNPKFLEKYHLTFSDAGIDFTTKSIESKIAWTHYTRVLENDLVILLIYGRVACRRLRRHVCRAVGDFLSPSGWCISSAIQPARQQERFPNRASVPVGYSVLAFRPNHADEDDGMPHDRPMAQKRRLSPLTDQGIPRRRP
jgi:hypothetical protein